MDETTHDSNNGGVTVNEIDSIETEKTDFEAVIETAKKRERELTGFLKAARAVLEIRDFTKAARAIFDMCRELTGAQSGYIALLSDDGSENEVLFLEAGGLPCTVDPELPMPIRGLRAESFKTGKVVFDNDFANSKWMNFMPGGHVNLKNVMFAPLPIDGNIVGLMGLANKPEDFDEDDRRVAMIFGELAAISLMNNLKSQALTESETRYHAVFDNAGESFFLLDMNAGKVVDANKMAHESLGYSRDEFLDLHISDIDPLMADGSLSKIVEDIDRSGEESFETIHITKSGEQRDVVVSSRKISIRDWDYVHVISRDITEARKAEIEKIKLRNQLEQSQKMEAIGQMAGGVAHEFNNLLGIMMGCIQLASQEVQKNSAPANELMIAMDTARNARDLTRKLLSFSREERLDVQPIAVNEIVQDTLEFVKRSISHSITIQLDLGADLLPVKVDRNQIRQALINICNNSADAMPTGGTLTISTNVCKNDGSCRIESAENKDVCCSITIADTGVGMAEKIRHQIFDPFFTTKGVGQGTGLGLSVTHGIIRNHGGSISVESERGEGCRVSIWLPFTDEESAGEVAGAEPDNSGTETVMIVDDEKGLLRTAAKILKINGYNVYTFSNPVEAVKDYRSEYKNIDIVLIDMIMPEMSGSELYFELKKINPDVKVVLASGFSPKGEASGLLATGVNAFIQKPYVIDELCGVIRRVMDN